MANNINWGKIYESTAWGSGVDDNTIGNGGAYKHTAENSIAMEKDEVDFLTNKHRDIAEHYTRRFIDYMSFNNANFPEYNAATNEDMYPDKDAVFAGWNL